MTERLCECGCGQSAPLSKRTVRRMGQRKGAPLRFIHGHGARDTRSPAERILARVTIDEPTGCWLWDRPGSRGYAFIHVGRKRQAHRVSYEAFIGPIPEGLTLDHLCRVPACVNPEHLEPVTLAENTRRAWRSRKEPCND